VHTELRQTKHPSKTQPEVATRRVPIQLKQVSWIESVTRPSGRAV
jgi:hypothetical protein